MWISGGRTFLGEFQQVAVLEAGRVRESVMAMQSEEPHRTF